MKNRIVIRLFEQYLMTGYKVVSGSSSSGLHKGNAIKVTVESDSDKKMFYWDSITPYQAKRINLAIMYLSL